MGDKTSYRRLNLKPRDPMAEELSDYKYHQRVIRNKKKKDHKRDQDYEDDY